MFQNPRGVTPLNWRSLVAEAIQRRKLEKITQREHAALANVSVPTIAAFDRGEMTLSLAKAFDILRVVGLVDEPTTKTSQDAFVEDSFNRWFNRWHTVSNGFSNGSLGKSLGKPLDKSMGQPVDESLGHSSDHSLSDSPDDLQDDSPNRFPPKNQQENQPGYVQVDYYLEGDLKPVDLSAFKKMLTLSMTAYSGNPPFQINNQVDVVSNADEGVIEGWTPKDLGPQRSGRQKALHTIPGDFWRASPTGRLFLMRGYAEDTVETFPAGAIFDTVLPIWHMGEVLLHAEQLASLLQKDPNTSLTVHFRALYSGLSGRVLRAWANPLSSIGATTMIEGYAARSDEAMVEAVLPAQDLSSRLTDHLYPLASSLYERFGIQELSRDFVEAEVKRLVGNRRVG